MNTSDCKAPVKAEKSKAEQASGEALMDTAGEYSTPLPPLLEPTSKFLNAQPCIKIDNKKSK